MAQNIFFRELSADATEFLHELSDPELLRAREIPPEVAISLRREQVRKLEQNIATLRNKRAEFNRKMDEYVDVLRRLIASLESAGNRGGEPDCRAEGHGGGVLVRCVRCDDERAFDQLRILFARESADSIEQPTECYVCDAGVIKKGVFLCGRCGGESLTIRAR
jgi:hypothetical protein